MRLPELKIDLPEWKESDFLSIKAAETRIARIANGAGKGSDSFKNACRKLLKAVIQDAGASVSEIIVSSVDVRAFTFLLGSSEEFSHRVALSKALFNRLTLPRSPLSKLSLLQLIWAYFIRYDTVANPETLSYWRGFIEGQLSALSLNSESSDLSKYVKYSSMLFSPSGPKKVVNFSKDRKLDFDGAISLLGLANFGDSRFLTLCRYQYYLDILKTIPVGSEHELLAEIVKKDVVNAPFDEGKLLGNAVLQVLIDRSEGGSLSHAWQSVILNIAGDPRVPKSSPNYQQWWAILGEKRIALMRGWLSRFDLSLFLRVLEQSAKDDGNTDMERMFAPRKLFMEGLLDQTVVLESRLFLTNSAESYLIQNYKKNELPSYARVKGGQASVIYLQLENGLHLIEGTHSFSIRVMNKLPTYSKLNDYSKLEFQSRSLGAGLGEAYIREHQRDGGLLEAAHYPELTWQNKVIDHLSQFKLKLDVGGLISPSKYREYKSKFGVY